MVIPITVYTSLSFSMVACIAFMKQVWLLGTLWQLLFGMSTLNHMYIYEDYSGKSIVKKIDTALAHGVVVMSVYIATTQNINFISLCIFWACLLYMTLIFYVTNLSQLPNRSWEPWHATLHIAAVIGESALLLGYTNMCVIQ